MLGDARPGVAGLSPLCALQNGVISLIDCTLVEEPESTDEDGRCWLGGLGEWVTSRGQWIRGIHD